MAPLVRRRVDPLPEPPSPAQSAFRGRTACLVDDTMKRARVSKLEKGTGEQQQGSEVNPLVLVRKELFDGTLITAVFHEWDGSWQYLTPDGYELDRTDLVHQSDVFAADAALRELA